MAGGIGSRFWPSSTEEKPKQFLDILNVGSSLLQQTYERCVKIVPSENILVVSNKAYKDLILEQLPNLPEQNILSEPSRNNTAPCIAYTALHLASKDPEATFAVLPSDHIILKENEFLSKMNQAFLFAKDNDAIVTLGIQASRPDTGYGYIELGNQQGGTPNSEVYTVKAFKEKPNRETAQLYLDSGNYLWNAGIFIWNVNTILKSFEENANEILDVLLSDQKKFGTAEEQNYIDSAYPNTKSISVDFAILEKATNVYTIPADIGWSDLGTWKSLYAFLEKDTDGNVIHAKQTYVSDVKNSLVSGDDNKIIVIKGLDDYIVVDEPGALLIYPKSKEQEIKQLVKSLNK